MGRAEVGVVDTGLCNLRSAVSALESLGADVRVCTTGEELHGVDRVVLPGVGAFGDAVAALQAGGFPPVLDALRAAGTPVLGICLGLQLLCRSSDESPGVAGLGWFAADVRRIEARRVPHIGWNDTTWRAGSPLFRGLASAPHFYFVHSFHAVADDESIVHASCGYEATTVTASLVDGNVAAVQFHPEKSQDEGIAVLTNFLAWAPAREATCSSAA